MKTENKMSERRNPMKLQEGFTLMELLVTTAIIGIVAAVAVPQYSAYKTRAYDANTQSTLRTVFQACQDYWTFEGSNNPCLLNAAPNNESGLILSAEAAYSTTSDATVEIKTDGTAAVEVTINPDTNNTEYDFFATAKHTSSSNVYMIDHRGVVTLASVEAEAEPEAEDPCSQIDPNKPKKLAEAGCT